MREDIKSCAPFAPFSFYSAFVGREAFEGGARYSFCRFGNLRVVDIDPLTVGTVERDIKKGDLDEHPGDRH